jgi:hypothetical protein
MAQAALRARVPGGGDSFSGKDVTAQRDITELQHAIPEGRYPQELPTGIDGSLATTDRSAALKYHRIDRAAVRSRPCRRIIEPAAEKKRQHDQCQLGDELTAHAGLEHHIVFAAHSTAQGRASESTGTEHKHRAATLRDAEEAIERAGRRPSAAFDAQRS